MSQGVAVTNSAADFTEAGYVKALELASKSYEFVSFVSRPKTRHVLWRHDVDFSVHRALRLAEIEADADVRATYFMYPHSQFYNLLSSLVLPKARRIFELGHELGLHFDPTFYGPLLTQADLIRHAESESRLLADLFGMPPVAVSFHLFGVLEGVQLDEDEVAGMVNAYGRTIQTEYGYCSDSNGVWRHRRLHDVLERAEEDRLHVLTHPEWWTPEPMAPRSRIQRCLDGQAAAVGKYYDNLVDSYGRPNVR
ncbi:MAG TPA: hypothetical protein VGA47_12075 [Candidatus Dormibacteraeota bacterium]